MLKRTMAAALAIAIAVVAGPVAAQVCTVGVYADSNGQTTTVQPVEGQTFDAYVVLFTEDLANAVAYRLDSPGLGSDIIQVGAAYGPAGTGINIPTASGNNVGLGECAIGFTGLPIVVAKYTFLSLASSAPTTLGVLGNVDYDPASPAYSTCQGVIKLCESGPTLTVEGPVANESASFGAVKSLYRN